MGSSTDGLTPVSAAERSLAARGLQWAGLAAVSDGVAGRLLVTFHLTHQRPMMSTFLDVLGIPHDNGLISDESAPTVDPEKLPEAVKAIREQYPAEDVNLYLHTLRLQDHATWGIVAEYL